MTASAPPAPPRIFSPRRRIALRQRMRVLQRQPDAARFVIDDMIDDVLDRLAFLRHTPARALVVGDFTGSLAAALAAQGAVVTHADPAPGGDSPAIDEEQPLPFAQPFDLIASLGTLDTVNDLPGALIHLRRALAPDGLMIAALNGAGSLPALRAVMLTADGDRPAPRIHPQVDVRAGGQLLQRAGFADPVVDSHSITVSYRSLDRLVGDLRAQALSACLSRGGAPLGKAALARARAAFADVAQDGRVTETFEILTLSGWAKALRPPKF
ncbi:methyltransferase domain-containing protein [Novosphingobium sp. FSW06-99]|uniref:methyltransferase domain-containing protein n=1 Tax=Novosphingobium sp. FSW06-99 TaxID=1739113 RepID=UPI00076D88CC|nr:methyltransferase domain-containing protein [Novosphingobium sp. FSW06-99]KUR77124.1 methyltransferase [Novosphingobium sp. FSW06-99]